MRFLIAATSVLTLFLMSVGAISVAGAENVVGQKIHVRDAAAENAVGQKIHARDANSDTPLCEQYEIECDMAEENYMQSGCMDPKPPNPSTCSDLEESLDSCQTFLGTNCQEKANHVAAAKNAVKQKIHARDANAKNAVTQKIHARDAPSWQCAEWKQIYWRKEKDYENAGCSSNYPPDLRLCESISDAIYDLDHKLRDCPP